MTYVLDEPSAGLHPVERGAVLDMCRRFIAEGNSVLLVEHDMELVKQADWIVDVGPLAGERGGQVVYSGPVADYIEAADSADTPTARALARPRPTPKVEARPAHGDIALRRVHSHTIDGLDVDFGLGQFTAITGLSGSGKSTLLAALHDMLTGPDCPKQVKPVSYTHLTLPTKRIV